jgi:hypothetical protein
VNPAIQAGPRHRHQLPGRPDMDLGGQLAHQLFPAAPLTGPHRPAGGSTSTGTARYPAPDPAAFSSSLTFVAPQHFQNRRQ